MRYHTVRETLYREDIGYYQTYGIQGVDEQGRVVVGVSDVSTEWGVAQSIVRRCNEGSASPYHLHDIVQDTI